MLAVAGQHLTHALLDAVGGELADDATSLCFDWHGSAQGDGVAHAGAEHRTQRNAQWIRRDPLPNIIPRPVLDQTLASLRRIRTGVDGLWRRMGQAAASGRAMR